MKLYVPEVDSDTFKAFVLDGVTVVTSFIARLELWATLRRKESAGLLQAGGARKALATYDADVADALISGDPIDFRVTARFEATIEAAYQLHPPVFLRTLDAIHLATAIASGELEFVFTDVRLRQAASRLGLTISRYREDEPEKFFSRLTSVRPVPAACTLPILCLTTSPNSPPASTPP